MPFLLIALFLAGGFLLSSFIIMVIWGALALSFGFQTIGFGTACLVTLALSVFRGIAVRTT